MTIPELADLMTEAYCIEHNLPRKRRYTHDELAAAIQALREAHRQLYGPPAPA